MSPRDEQYRWWLLSGDLEVVTDGSVGGATLVAALASLSRELERRGYRGRPPASHAYSVIVYKGESVVAVRPSTLGIC